MRIDATVQTRRRFLRSAVTTAAVGLPAPGIWSGIAPAASRMAVDELKLGAVGIGNRGNDNLAELDERWLAAICDVDTRYLEQCQSRFRRARSYRDYRELIDRESLDGVIISCPDHGHAAAATRALKKGWHVYCERPLARTIDEVRTLRRWATSLPVATQMGNQHHSSAGYALARHWLRSGVLGTIRSVHAWTSKPDWPQGNPPLPPPENPPASLHWDLWLGPAEARPYRAAFHPFLWRGWWDFGTGTPGDVSIHLLDPVFWALELKAPRRIWVESSDAASGRTSAGMLPAWSIVHYEFSAGARHAAFELVWYDGGKLPPREVTGASRLPPQGVLVIGERGKIFIPELGQRPRIVPTELEKEIALGPPTDSLRSHMRIWLDACRGMGTTNSDFVYGADLTSLVLWGLIALREGATSAEPLTLDPTAHLSAAIAHHDRFARWETATYRRGWELVRPT